jgi:hypothetical protein
LALLQQVLSCAVKGSNEATRFTKDQKSAVNLWRHKEIPSVIAIGYIIAYDVGTRFAIFVLA